MDKYNINNFYFVKNAEEVDEGGKSNEDMLRNLNRSAVNSTANHVIAELDKSFSQVVWLLGNQLRFNFRAWMEDLKLTLSD